MDGIGVRLTDVNGSIAVSIGSFGPIAIQPKRIVSGLVSHAGRCTIARNV